MKKESKHGLRNATDLLNRIRNKYLKPSPDRVRPIQHNKTFIEEESLELYEHQSNQSENKTSSYKKQSRKKEPIVEELSEIKQNQRGQPSFCDKLIIKNLEQTFKIYQEDLKILNDNRDFLQEQIELLVDKIRKLRDLQQHNRSLKIQNQKAKGDLNLLMEQYHHSMQLLFSSQLAQQQAFNSMRNKITKVIKETGEDYHYIGFVSHWNRHVEQLSKDRQTIQQLIDKQKKEVKAQEEEELKKGRERKENKLEKEPADSREIKEESQIQEQKGEPPKVQKIVVAPKEKSSKFEEDYLAPDDPKPKKKLSQSEKASLLGDLKSFAKNFKLK